eukprot:CAMPEP_0170063744 /NCGR_PEP_ID=MMETSP0019_2-20121128/4498_1 /TAXON_ID=98059 /ORGANISM="Dinobryon sp., Strain UTEXLB2267" /LENGTH=142 /DNA_ID=CAMNT_0010270253 /DNA_START=183 /DNA_END=611 /DNA_ORIENTATION=-
MDRCEIVEIRDYGVVMKINRAQDALLHISQLSHDKMLLKNQLKDLLKVGQRLRLKVYFVEKATGLVKVSRKQLLDELTSVPDVLDADESLITEFTQSKEENVYLIKPSFPIDPPRRYSPDYFRASVATKNDISNAMKDYEDN